MSSPPVEDVIRAFASVVRRRLARGTSTEVPNLGTFTVEHVPGHIEEQEDGPETFRPPQDIVAFVPDANASPSHSGDGDGV
jgi:nucleoid DNA-binding protein